MRNGTKTCSRRALTSSTRYTICRARAKKWWFREKSPRRRVIEVQLERCFVTVIFDDAARCFLTNRMTTASQNRRHRQRRQKKWCGAEALEPTGARVVRAAP